MSLCLYNLLNAQSYHHGHSDSSHADICGPRMIVKRGNAEPGSMNVGVLIRSVRLRTPLNRPRLHFQGLQVNRLNEQPLKFSTYCEQARNVYVPSQHVYYSPERYNDKLSMDTLLPHSDSNILT